MKEYMSLVEIAKYIGMSKWYLYKLTAKKAIPFRKIGSRCVFKKSEIDKHIDKFKVDLKEVSNDK